MEPTQADSQDSLPSCVLDFRRMFDNTPESLCLSEPNSPRKGRDFAVICDDIFTQYQSKYRNHDQNEHSSTDLSVADPSDLTNAEIDTMFSRLEICHKQLANVPNTINQTLIINHDPRKLASLVHTLLDFIKACLLSIIYITPTNHGYFLRSIARVGILLQRLGEILSVSSPSSFRKPTTDEEDDSIQTSFLFHHIYVSLRSLPNQIQSASKQRRDNQLVFRRLTIINIALLVIIAIPANCYTSDNHDRNLNLIYAAANCTLEAQLEAARSLM
ncbi:hypothetical protein JOM56_013478 [Amanita muscaria]